MTTVPKKSAVDQRLIQLSRTHRILRAAVRGGCHWRLSA